MTPEEQQAVMIKGFEIAAGDLNRHDEAIARLVEFAQTAGNDLESFKAGLDQLNESQHAEHKKLQELAKLLDEVKKTWQANFERQAALLNEQSRFLEALRAIVLPDAVN
jgi:chromosome segregation ATPase